MIIEIEESAEVLWTEIQGSSGPSKKLFMKVIGKYLDEWISARRLKETCEKKDHEHAVDRSDLLALITKQARALEIATKALKEVDVLEFDSSRAKDVLTQIQTLLSAERGKE